MALVWGARRAGYQQSWAESLLAGKIFGGRVGGGENLDYVVDVSELQDALDHAGGAGEAEHATGSFQAGMGFHDLADDGAIDMVDAGEIEDYEFFVVLDVLLDVVVDFRAIISHGDAAGEFDDDDAGLDVLFGEFHESLLFAGARNIRATARAIRVEATLAREVRQAEEEVAERIASGRRERPEFERALAVNSGQAHG
jgi:hypothetical protein